MGAEGDTIKEAQQKRICNYPSLLNPQQLIKRHSPAFLRNIVQIITEAGFRIKKELLPMRKDQIDLANATVWVSDSKTENGVAEVPLTSTAVKAFQNQIKLAGPGDYLFPSGRSSQEHQKSVKRVWRTALRRAGVPYFRIYDLRSAYSTRRGLSVPLSSTPASEKRMKHSADWRKLLISARLWSPCSK